MENTHEHKNTVTRKKVKILGRKKYRDEATGESIDAVVTLVEERDFNFTKVWMMSLLPQLKMIGNKKIEVCAWVIDHLNKDGQLVYTYRQISEKSGVSLETVKTTMQKLIECDFLRRHNTGCYIVNPDILFKGSKASRDNALFQFRSVSGTGNAPTSMTKQMQVEELQKNVNQLQERIAYLTKQIEKEDTEDKVDARRKEENKRKAEEEKKKKREEKKRKAEEKKKAEESKKKSASVPEDDETPEGSGTD